jgi:3-(3-hydroxy-phenyl)propionate hydroxylase
VTDRRYDVILVGYGPVGEVAANLLGQAGMRVAVYETATGIYTLPRAVGFDAEIMRIFQSIGLAEAIQPSIKPLTRYEFVTAEEETLFKFDAPEPPTYHHWATNYMFYQPELEAALQSGVTRFPNVEVYPGHEVTAIRQHDSGVEVDVRQTLTGSTFTATSDYLIGCDGARSITRKLAGIELDDLNFDQPWLVIDVMLKREVNTLPSAARQVCDPARPTTIIPSRGNHRRWEFMLMPGDDPNEIVDIERVWELLSPWIGPDDAEITRHVVYTFHGLIAQRWRDGRVFLAGDSAHQMPPFLGQGMCSGLRDASNIAWKLDLVRRGIASDALLDTYEVERSPHVRSITERAMHLGSIIQATDPEVARLRDENFRSAPDRQFTIDDDTGPMKQRMPGIEAGVRTDSSDDRVGQLFPQGLLALRDGSEPLLDDVIGLRFAVIAGDHAAASITDDTLQCLAAIAPACIAVGGGKTNLSVEWTRVIDRTGVIAKTLGDSIVVVRPDRYIYGTANNDGELSTVIEGLLKQLSTTGIAA